MVRLNNDVVEFPQKKATQTIQEAVFQTSQLQEEPLGEQHFGGLSDHFADETLEGFAARATQCVRDHPFTSTFVALAAGVFLGMLTAPVAARPVKALRRRLQRRTGPETFETTSPFDANLSPS